MNHIKKLVFATNNQHKLEEARRIVSDGFEIVSLAEIGCHDDIPETADTLEGNALIKARWVHDRYGLDCFADDTGLMVDALDGAPGVYSARYAGEQCNSADNVAKLLREMEGVESRDAHFSTCMALVAGGEEHCFEGRVDGEIATEPHGDGGFGYDPVFRARETGKCFAEMSADAKNAISHRGRALRKLRDFLGVALMLVVSMLTFASASAESWRIHPSFDGKYQQIFDTKDYVYFLAYKTEFIENQPMAGNPYINIIRWDKDAEQFDYLSSQNKLSENVVVCAAYNYDKNYLIVTYDNGNIDVLYDNGDVVNIPALMLADADLSRRVNSITFDADSDEAYLATEFGYVAVDVKQGEVTTSRIFHQNLRSAAKFKGKLLVSTDDGLYYGSPTAFNLNEMTKLGDLSTVRRMIPFGDRLYLQYGSFWTQKGAVVVPDGEGFRAEVLNNSKVTDIGRGKDNLIVVYPSEIHLYDKEYARKVYALDKADKTYPAASYDGREFWFGSGRKGIAAKTPPATGADPWTLKRDYMLPNAANTMLAPWMAIHPTYGVLVRNQGYGYNFMNYPDINDLISAYKNMEWTPMSTTYRSDNTALLIYTPNGLAIDPNNTDHVYCGSPKSGLLRLDLKNPDNSLHMSKPGDMLGGYGKTGFVEIVPDHNWTAWPQVCGFATPVFDSSGYMWTAYYNPDTNEASGNTTPELWYWSPSDRAATTSQSTYRPFKKHALTGIPNGMSFRLLALSTGNNKNTILFYAGSNQAGIRVINTGGNPENKNGWTEKQMSVIYDQDSKEIDLNYVMSWMEDPSTGLVWVGYNDGVFTFNPRTALAGTPDARRLKVPRNDGTNLADYLLDGINVLAMAIDSQGRKWFGTKGAGLVCTASDGRTILKTYTTETSEIPDDNVYGLCYNQQTNSLMVSTGLGLCELFLSGENGSASDDGVRAYPNPVRPDYFGYVTIDNLPENATVKIVDAAGNLMKDIGLASSGSVEWDVTNINHKRVPAGVYYVLASNGPDAESYSKVSKILVVN